jgi:hypothetical protein
MSEMPNCVAGRRRCKMLKDSYFGLLRIREFNQNLRSFAAGVTESIAHRAGLKNEGAVAVSTRETAPEMLVNVTGCTIGVYKCIQ